MRILILNDYGVLSGGAERVTVDLRDGLRAMGHDARIFASTAQPLRLANEADYTCSGHDGVLRRVLQVANPAAALALRRVLAEFRPEIVHVRMFLTQLSPLILSVLGRVPTLLHVGNFQTICPLNTRILPDGSVCRYRAGAACYRQGCVSALGLARTLVQLRTWRRRRTVFRLIVANSHALADTLRANDVDVGPVIWNGTRGVAARPPLQGPPTLAFAGRLVAKKGVDLLLHATALVVRQLPSARLLIVGDGEERDRLECLIRDLGLLDNVTMCGHLTRPELDRRLATAWVQVLPSRYPEPFANAVTEAMMRGTAVVGTAAGGTAELVRDGFTGYLVPVGDAPALAERLLSLLTDREAAERLGRAAREVALAQLTLERMVARFERVYTQLLSPGGETFHSAAQSGHPTDEQQ
jgi:glycosyltransferase involved in cell wall biosynthesis